MPWADFRAGDDQRPHPRCDADRRGPEVVARDGVDGYLVEPGDAAELAERLIHVLELSGAEREAMGLDARARVQELFGEAAMVEQLASAYMALSRRVRSW